MSLTLFPNSDKSKVCTSISIEEVDMLKVMHLSNMAHFNKPLQPSKKWMGNNYFKNIWSLIGHFRKNHFFRERKDDLNHYKYIDNRWDEWTINFSLLLTLHPILHHEEYDRVSKQEECMVIWKEHKFLIHICKWGQEYTLELASTNFL